MIIQFNILYKNVSYLGSDYYLGYLFIVRKDFTLLVNFISIKLDNCHRDNNHTFFFHFVIVDNIFVSYSYLSHCLKNKVNVTKAILR